MLHISCTVQSTNYSFGYVFCNNKGKISHVLVDYANRHNNGKKQ